MPDQPTVENSIAIAALMPLIGRITCHVRNQNSLIYKELGYELTPEASDALMIIHHFDGLPQKNLADILGKDKASITRLLNTLVKNQLVQRTQDQNDRRIIRAHITNEGKSAFLKIHPKIKNLSDKVVQGISPQDFNTTLETLSKIIANVGETCCKP